MFENAAREDFLESGHLGRMQHTTLWAYSAEKLSRDENLATF